MKVRYSDIDVFLEPGELYVSDRPTIVKTILGSCVAVCLYDAKVRVGGINHYVMPRPMPNDVPGPRYGTSSIQELIERVRRKGASMARLRARVYGGARPLGGERGPQVGAANREIAIQMLRSYQVPVVEEQTGGERGRRVFFNIGTGQVFVSIIERNPTLWAGASRRRRA